jgi:DNA polymerase-3 subunit alpha
MNDPNRWTFDNDEFFMKSRRQMKESFLKHHGYMSKKMIKESLDSTVLFAEKTTAQLVEDYHKALLPKVDIPKPYKNEWDYLKGLCFKGWEWRGIEKRAEVVAKRTGRSFGAVRDEYKRRMIHEMNQLKKQRFVGYLLMVHDIYNFARGVRIMVGPGRGSIAGSLVAFLIGLSAVDPIEHGLIFERFINPNRVDMPDVDMDFEDARRHEIFQYLRDKYGADRCAQIATIGKLSGKQCAAEGTEITMSDGASKPIEEVRAGDYLTNIDPTTLEKQITQVIAVHNNGEEEVYKITGEGGEELCLTAGHEVLTDSGWKKVVDLLLSDTIIDVRCLKGLGSKYEEKREIC